MCDKLPITNHALQAIDPFYDHVWSDLESASCVKPLYNGQILIGRVQNETGWY